MSDESFYIIASAIFIILALIKMIFAVEIITIILSNWKRKCRSILNLQTCNSCFGSIFYVFAVSVQVPLLFDTTYQDDLFCKIRGFIYLSACAVKSYSYFSQAISRYFITIHYKRKILRTFRINILMILISWITAMIISSLLFINFQAYQYESESHLCIMTSKIFVTSFYPAFVIFAIPACIVIFLYGFILSHSTYSNRINPDHFPTIRTKRNVKVFGNILLLLFILIIGGMPYFLSIIINRAGSAPKIFYLISILFISLACTLELLIIFFTNKDVKTILYTKIGWHQAETINTKANMTTMRKNQIKRTMNNNVNKIEPLPTIC